IAWARTSALHKTGCPVRARAAMKEETTWRRIEVVMMDSTGMEAMTERWNGTLRSETRRLDPGRRTARRDESRPPQVEAMKRDRRLGFAGKARTYGRSPSRPPRPATRPA